MAGPGVRPVTSNQDGIYRNLEQVVRKYGATRFLRPVADHTREAFDRAREFVIDFYERKYCERLAEGKERPQSPEHSPNCALDSPKFAVVLDSGCGTGESTLHLARKFPDTPVIGIDKSAMRLNKAGNVHQQEAAGTDIPPNALWIRAELLDFWKLALDEVRAGRWEIVHHALYYPNPWPKESEAGRRFHLHPIFPTLMALSPVTELRTNWNIYAREFAAAAKILCNESCEVAATGLAGTANILCEAFEPLQPETAFERKYKEARQQLWRVLVKR
mgnify:FL=1